MDQKSKIPLVIIGPTASGKTKVATALARELNGEVLGLDSRQIYRYLEIGTTQPTSEERKEIPHHLYGFRNPDQMISAGEYAKLGWEKIEEIFERGNLPIFCCGSGLYYRALTQGIFEGSATNLDIRKKLKDKLEKEGSSKLLEKLQIIDPEYAKIVHPHNHKRLIRALEIYETTGLSPSEHFKLQKGKQVRYSFFSVYLNLALNHLQNRIEHRTRYILEQGWIDEVKLLIERGYSVETHPIDSLGYKQIISHLEGKLGYDEMVDEIVLKTRQYAKKQIKWFKREDINLIIDIIDNFSTNDIVKIIVLEYKKHLRRDL